MVRKRDKVEIIRDILKVCRSEKQASVTKLVYKCNSNFISMTEYVAKLQNKGFINPVQYGSRTRYEITDIGLDKLRVLEAAKMDEW